MSSLTEPPERISVGIASRDRRDSLRRALRSIKQITDIVDEVIVADCGYAEPLGADEFEDLENEIGCQIRVLHIERTQGPIKGRNLIASSAKSKWLLSMDDDAAVFDRTSVVRALSVMIGDPEVAACAFAQCDPNGRLYPEGMQAGRGDFDQEVPCYTGFGVLHRLETFRALGGYFEPLEYYGEEKDYCLRVCGAGQKVVYLPDARIIHVADPATRNLVKYVRYFTRNDCVTALRLFPWPVGHLVTLSRLASYGRGFLGRAGTRDPDGRRWIVSELLRLRCRINHSKSRLTYATIGKWRQLKKTPVPYSFEGRDRSER